MYALQAFYLAILLHNQRQHWRASTWWITWN